MILKSTGGVNRRRRTVLREEWFTSFPDPSIAKQHRSAMPTLVEGWLPPSSGPQPPKTSGEVVTYVREGSIIYNDSNQVSQVLRAGEFHRITLGSGFSYNERNESTTHWARILQIWLSIAGTSQAGYESKLFGVAERRQGLCLVASPEGRDASLTVHQNCDLYSTLMPKGRYLVHPIAPHRTVCLQVVEGEVQLNELTLQAGDIALVKDEPSVSFLARSYADVLLIDSGRTPPRSNGGLGEDSEPTRPSHVGVGSAKDGFRKRSRLLASPIRSPSSASQERVWWCPSEARIVVEVELETPRERCRVGRIPPPGSRPMDPFQ